MKKTFASLLAVPILIAAGLAMASPRQASAGFEHCHVYSSGFQCDHACLPMDICCTDGYECEGDQ